MKETPVYEEWKVHSVNSKKIVARLAGLIEEVKQAKDAPSCIKAMKAYGKYCDKIGDNFATISLKYTLDTRDKTNIKNEKAIDKAMPEIQAASLPYADAVLSSPFRDEIEKKFGSLYLTMLEFQKRSFSPEIVELSQKENDLTTRYDALKSQAMAHFEGKDYGLGEIGAFYGDKDRSRRKAAHDAAIEAVDKIAPELADIYDQLVKIRTEKAHRLGFESYTDLSYFIMGRYDYTKEDVAGYRNEIHEFVTPIVEKIARGEAKSLGLKALSYQDLEVYYPEGNPVPSGTTDEKVEHAKEMYDAMSEETGRFFRFMVEKHLLFLDAKPGKALGGYMNYFPVKKCPIIFSNFNGTSGDVDVLTHEFGHAFQSYLAKNITIPEYRCPTMDGAEIDSMSMEFFAWPYMGMFFEEPDKYRYQHLASALVFLPYGVTVDEFQHWVYDHPEASKEERRRAWKEIEAKFTPYKSKAYEGAGYLGDGLRWIMQGHIFSSPFYYIDYTLAQVVAFEFLALDHKNHERAWKKYIKLCKLGGKLPFQHLVRKAGLVSPLDPGALRKIVAPVKRILKEEEEKAYGI